MTKLRRRMEEELRLRGYSPATIKAYLWGIRNFAQFHGRSPDQMGAEEVRTYLLHLTEEKKLSPTTINQVVCAIRFFYINVSTVLARLARWSTRNGRESCRRF